MSIHNVCFRREIKKILCGYPLLSVTMCREQRLWMHMLICVFVVHTSEVMFSQVLAHYV